MTAVFVHGNPETPAVWEPLIAELGRADVVNLHLPGFGIPTPAGFGATKEEYVAWLTGELEAIGEPVDLVGHDWGGGFVLRLACTRPDLIRTWANDVAGLLHPDYVWHDFAQIWQTPGAGEEYFASQAGTPRAERIARFQAIGITPAAAESFADAAGEEMARCVLALYRSAAQPAMRQWGEDRAARGRPPRPRDLGGAGSLHRRAREDRRDGARHGRTVRHARRRRPLVDAAGPRPRGGRAARVLVRRHHCGMRSFSAFMADALYGPTGFYTAGGGAGRRRDFVTSPEVGPLFGAVIARALDSWWEELGRPDPFVVVEAGAGPGTLARSILHAGPRMLPALRYVLVDVSPELQAVQRAGLALVPPSELLGPVVRDEDGDREPVHGAGPIISALSELPSETLQHGVVIANELLDNLPFDIVQRTADGWDELGVDDGRWSSVPASPSLRALLPAGTDGIQVGAAVPVQRAAGEWLRRALGLVRHGRVVVIDYAAPTTRELGDRPRTGWLRTYRGHDRGGDPLDRPGSQDITADVAVDQLAAVRRPTAVHSQADFLRAHGIDELVEEGRARWTAGAARPDLHALEGRSRVTEASALLDPDGLGAFTVLEWVL